MNKIIKELINTKEISKKIEEQEHELFRLRAQIEMRNPQIQEIVKMGFAVVMHDNSISFLNYDQPQKGEIHYGVRLQLNPLSISKKHEDVTDEDVQKIAKILKLQGAKNE